jgi:hypothetical protein
MQYNCDIEVIGAGLGRTGTMSLKAALEILGYSSFFNFSFSISYLFCSHNYIYN